MGEIKEDYNGLHSNKLEKCRSDNFFLNFNLICMTASFTMLENHSCLLCGSDFAHDNCSSANWKVIKQN